MGIFVNRDITEKILFTTERLIPNINLREKCKYFYCKIHYFKTPQNVSFNYKYNEELTEIDQTEKDQKCIVFQLDAALQLRSDKNLDQTNLYNTIIIHNVFTYLKGFSR